MKKLLCLLVLIIMPIRSGTPQLGAGKCQLVYRDDSQKNIFRAVDVKMGTIGSDPRLDEGLLSPDGRLSVTVVSRGGKQQLALTRLVGVGNIVLINTGDFDVSHPAWSPDSKSIAATLTKDNISNIYLINAMNGQVATNLTNASSQDDFAAWSPDGSTIAFRSNRSLPDLLWMVNADGSDLRHYAAGGGPYAWSPDGKYIAAQTPPNRIDVLEVGSGTVVSVDGGNIRRSAPTWSPDSAWLGYIEGGKIESAQPQPGSTEQPATNALVKIRPDGSERIVITPADKPVQEAQWAPDADLIAFTSNGQLYLINGDGADLHAFSGAAQASLIHWVCLPGK